MKTLYPKKKNRISKNSMNDSSIQDFTVVPEKHEMEDK